MTQSAVNTIIFSNYDQALYIMLDTGMVKNIRTTVDIYFIISII